MPLAFGPTGRFPAGLLAVERRAGDVVVRVHHQDHGAVFFGPKPGTPPQNRFDAPSGEYRVLYAAERLEGAFVESVLRRPAGRVLRRAFVEERMWTPLRLGRPLILAKVLDEGLQFHRVDAGVSASDDYAASAPWLSPCTPSSRRSMVWPTGHASTMVRCVSRSSIAFCQLI